MNNAEHIELHDSFQSTTDLFVFDLKMNWIFIGFIFDLKEIREHCWEN